MEISREALTTSGPLDPSQVYVFTVIEFNAVCRFCVVECFTLIKLHLLLKEQVLTHVSLLFLAGNNGPELRTLLVGIISGAHSMFDGRRSMESVSEK